MATGPVKEFSLVCPAEQVELPFDRSDAVPLKTLPTKIQDIVSQRIKETSSTAHQTQTAKRSDHASVGQHVYEGKGEALPPLLPRPTTSQQSSPYTSINKRIAALGATHYKRAATDRSHLKSAPENLVSTAQHASTTSPEAGSAPREPDSRRKHQKDEGLTSRRQLKGFREKDVDATRATLSNEPSQDHRIGENETETRKQHLASTQSNPVEKELASQIMQRYAVLYSAEQATYDSWPAAVTTDTHRHLRDSGNHSQSRGHDDPLIELDSNLDPKAKPRVLVEIESMIHAELQKIDPKHGSYEKARFLIFRDAFGSLAQQFVTYRPILSIIKSEYDRIVDKYELELQQIKPLKTRLETISDQYKQDWERWAETVEKEIKHWKLICEQSKSEIQSLKAKLQVETDKNTEMTRQLDFAKENVRDSFGKRQELASKARKMEEQVFQKISELEDSRRAEERMRIQYESVQNDLHQSLLDIARSKEQILSMVPASKLEEANVETKRLNYQIESLEQMLKESDIEHKKLLEVNKNLTESLELLKEERGIILAEKSDIESKLYSLVGEYPGQSKSRLSSSTIAPSESQFDFSALESTLGQGSLRGLGVDTVMAMMNTEINKLRQECEDLRNLLPKQHMTNNSVQELGLRLEQFVGLGTHEQVPKYLRFSGRLKNRMLTKRDTEFLVRDVWSQYLRKMSASKESSRETMADFLYSYLKKRFESQELIAEWGYNITHALEKYYYDSDLKLFHRVLTGQLLEDVYIDDLELLQDLEKAMRKQAEQNPHSKIKGTLTKQEILGVVRSMIPAKSTKNMDMLRDALEYDQPGESVVFHKLFEEDQEYNQCAFIETLRHQLMEERDRYIREIELFLNGQSHLRTSLNSITLHEAREMFKKIDPTKIDADVSKVMAKIFPINSRTGHLETNAEVSLEQFIAAIRRVSIRRSGPAFAS